MEVDLCGKTGTMGICLEAKSFTFYYSEKFQFLAQLCKWSLPVNWPFHTPGICQSFSTWKDNQELLEMENICTGRKKDKHIWKS